MLYQIGSSGWVIDGTRRSTIALPGAACWAKDWLTQTNSANNDSRRARISISFSLDDQAGGWMTSIESKMRHANRITSISNDDKHPHDQKPHGRELTASLR